MSQLVLKIMFVYFQFKLFLVKDGSGQGAALVAAVEST
jgi:hypothetical protein